MTPWFGQNPKKVLLITAIVLVVVANLLGLAGDLFNRSGVKQALLLSAKEFTLPTFRQSDFSSPLRVSVRTQGQEGDCSNCVYFKRYEREFLEELARDNCEVFSENNKEMRLKPWVLLELNGALSNEARTLPQEKNSYASQSRLFAVSARLDRRDVTALRDARFDARDNADAQYMIVRGSLDMTHRDCRAVQAFLAKRSDHLPLSRIELPGFDSVRWPAFTGNQLEQVWLRQGRLNRFYLVY